MGGRVAIEETREHIRKVFPDLVEKITSHIGELRYINLSFEMAGAPELKVVMKLSPKEAYLFGPHHSRGQKSPLTDYDQEVFGSLESIGDAVGRYAREFGLKVYNGKDLFGYRWENDFERTPEDINYTFSVDKRKLRRAR